MKNKELTIKLEKELSPLAKQAAIFSIQSDADLKVGVELLSTLNQYNDRILAEKAKITKPLNEALKAERARWKPIELQNEEAISSIRLEMTRYQTNLVNSRKEAELSIASRIGQGKGHIKLETAVSKIENLPEVEKEHPSESGLVQFREKKTLKITNIDLIRKFDEYWDLNETRLLDDLKEGKIVPGAEIEIISVPVNYR